MQKRTLGRTASKSPPSARLHGPELGLRPPRLTAQAIALIRARGRARRHVVRHRAGLRPFTNEELVGEALEPFRDRGRHRHQVRLRHRPGDGETRRARQPAGAHPAVDRRLAEAPAASRRSICYYQHRVDPERADRGRRRHGEGADRRGQGEALRPLRSRRARRSVARTRCSRSPPCRASTRCGGASRRRTMLPTLEELGIGFVPFSPLGNGFLTGQDRRDDEVRQHATSATRVPRFAPERARPIRRWSICSSAIAAQKGATPAQIALAWLLAQKPWIVPIPGHDEAASPRGEPRRGRRRAHAGRSPRRSSCGVARSPCRAPATRRRRKR